VHDCPNMVVTTCLSRLGVTRSVQGMFVLEAANADWPDALLPDLGANSKQHVRSCKVQHPMMLYCV
jgi:hypothetical protein